MLIYAHEADIKLLASRAPELRYVTQRFWLMCNFDGPASRKQTRCHRGPG